ncbi:MAG: helix-turn-helix domain-containing protein [Candidatus Omnitrophota bacterium]|jgi:excisionase family DNA binding protein
MNNMLTLDEVKNFLGVEQQVVEKFIQDGVLHAYKIGGVYIRFRKEEVLGLKYDVLLKKKKAVASGSFGQRLWDFWRFNNFYIISVLIILALAYWFLHTTASS